MATVTTDGTSPEPTSSSSDAHRNFCDLFEGEEDVPCLAPPASGPCVAAEASSAAAAGSISSTKGAANKTKGEHTGERTLPGAARTNGFFESAAASVRRGLVGRDIPFRTPYGMKPLVYSDWTATGRAVDSIEVQYYCPCLNSGVHVFTYECCFVRQGKHRSSWFFGPA